MRHGRGIFAAVVMLGSFAALHVACVGSDPDASTTGDASTNDTGTTSNDSGLAADAAPSLGCPLGCLPPAPSGWVGPSAVYDGDPSAKPSACPSTYTQKEVETFQGLSASAAECNCGSPTFTGASCTATVVNYPANGGCVSGTGTPQGTFSQTASGLRSCFQMLNAGSIKVSTADLDAGSCSFATPSTTLPDAGFTAQEMSCGLPQNAACSASAVCVATPVPDAPFTRLCIHQDGDIACPSADYAQRFVASKSFTDTRACSACMGTVSGGTCGTTWGIDGNSAQCQANAPDGSVTGVTCSAGLSIGTIIGGSIGPAGLDCLQDGGAPSGSAAATDPVTFCCNK